MFGFIRCRAAEGEITKLCLPVQCDLEIYISQPVRFVGLNVRLDLSFEEAIALKKRG